MLRPSPPEIGGTANDWNCSHTRARRNPPRTTPIVSTASFIIAAIPVTTTPTAIIPTSTSPATTLTTCTRLPQPKRGLPSTVCHPASSTVSTGSWLRLLRRILPSIASTFSWLLIPGEHTCQHHSHRWLEVMLGTMVRVVQETRSR